MELVVLFHLFICSELFLESLLLKSLTISVLSDTWQTRSYVHVGMVPSMFGLLSFRAFFILAK